MLRIAYVVVPLSLAGVAIGVSALMAQRGAPPIAAGPNPLIATWSGPYGGVPPWDQVRPEHFPGAFDAALAQERAEIDAIAANREAPTFENTIAALQRSGRTRERVERLFGVAIQNITNPQFQALEREWQPKLTAASDAIYMNGALFRRIETVHRDASATLAPDQRRLTTLLYDFFVRRGARLDAAQQSQLSKINQDLSTLFAEFRQKVLAAENSWTVLDGAADLAGLPAAIADAAKAAAA